MQCAHCPDARVQKFGTDRKGNQRYRCMSCRKTFTERKPAPLGTMRVEQARAVMALSMLLEGSSIRSVERLTRLHRDTVCDLITTVGPRCKAFLERTIHRLPVHDVQADEVWGFVGMKEKTRQAAGYGEEYGDAYCWIGMERNTKLVLAWHVAKRNAAECWAFTHKLYVATSGRYQLSTDGYGPYGQAVPLTYAFDVDFSQLIKRFGNTPGDDQRYSPGQITSIRKTIGCGDPNPDKVCTSHVERGNLSIRMAVRRMTRLTNAHSKKWANHEAMLALYFAWYNYCRRHMTLGTTPAVAAGIADEPWTLERLLREVAA